MNREKSPSVNLIRSVCLGLIVGCLPTTAGAEEHSAKPDLLDPELRKVWEYFSDYENRNRDVAVRLFADYLRNNPDTEFKPEIYFRIGQLYSSHRKDADRRKDLMVKYYRLAHEGYGLKYSDYNMTAWASIVNQPSETLADRLAYYDWLSGFETSARPEQMYPIYAMGIVAQGTVDSVDSSQEFRERQAKALSREIHQMMRVASEGVVYRSNADELREIERRYPGSLMASAAASKLKFIQELITNEAARALDDPAFGETMSNDTSRQAGSATQAPPSTQPDSSAFDGARQTEIAERGGIFLLWVLGGAVLVLGIVGAFWRRRRHTK